MLFMSASRPGRADRFISLSTVVFQFIDCEFDARSGQITRLVIWSRNGSYSRTPPTHGFIRKAAVPRNLVPDFSHEPRTTL